MNGVTRPELDARLDAVEARLDARVSRIEGIVQDIKDESKATRKTVISAAIAVFLGIGGINIGLIQTTISSFQAGQETSKIQADLQKQIADTNKLLLNTSRIIEEQKQTNINKQ